MSQGEQTNTQRPIISQRHFVVMMVLVCLAGAATGWFFGLLSESLSRLWVGDPPNHHHADPFIINVAGITISVGGALGAVLGLLAAVVWNLRMTRRALRTIRAGGKLGSLVGRGVLWGLIVGTGCSLAVHAGLMIVSGKPYSEAIVVGVPFGVCVGAMVGYFSGLLCYRAARKTAEVYKA